jgi:hypothetical protein
METTEKKEMGKDKQTDNLSLKKSLAIATVAASLGIALGVNMDAALAADIQTGSPPIPTSRQDKDLISRQDKDLISKQIKDANQIQQSMPQTNTQSNQIKIDNQAPQIIPGN